MLLVAAAACAGVLPTCALVPCDTDDECTKQLRRSGSICKVRERDDDGKKYCSNPFASGCLRAVLGEADFTKKRLCNSDDGPNAAAMGLCHPPSVFDYTEIRIGPSNWESTLFLSWAMQVTLTELADVPSTIETDFEDAVGDPLSFYDVDNDFGYSAATNNFKALEQANSLPNGDCTLTSKPCAHVLPEVWLLDERKNVDRRAIERDGSGMVGHLGWFVPRFVAKQHSDLMTHWGLTGEANREKLANMFLRPTTWGDFCREVSPTNCTTVATTVPANAVPTANVFDEPAGNEETVTIGDVSNNRPETAATRPPKDEEESALYFHADFYKGHFRRTDENNCSLPGKEGKCTGHIIDYPCKWDAFTDAQIYWNDIALDRSVNGSLEGYSYGEILQIMSASNATKSPAIFMWWYPELNLDLFEMELIALPTVTSECLENRPAVLEDQTRCELNQTVLQGSAEGGCGYNTQELEKIFASSLRRHTFAVKNEADRSPGYDVLRNFRISDIDMRKIMKAWAEPGVDTNGHDAREAVCAWVADNLREGKNLTRFIPEGFPRTIINESSYAVPLLYASVAFACIAIAVVLAITCATNWYRGEKIIRYAQLPFLRLFCLGYFIVAVGALVHTTEPTKGSCVARSWLVLVGYTLGIVPLLLKITAINKLMQESKKMKRVKISQRKLRVVVGLAVLVATVFLSIWTAVDPPTSTAERVLVSPQGGMVEVRHTCASSSAAWKAVAFGYEMIYILYAAVLAFTSRNVRQEFNESRKLANMAHSHLLFLILRIITNYVLPSAGVNPRDVAGTMSFLLSADCISSPSFYFLPKFLAIREGRRLAEGATARLPNSAVPAQGWGLEKNTSTPLSWPAQQQQHQRHQHDPQQKPQEQPSPQPPGVQHGHRSKAVFRVIGAGEVREQDSAHHQMFSSCTKSGITQPSIPEEEPERRAPAEESNLTKPSPSRPAQEQLHQQQQLEEQPRPRPPGLQHRRLSKAVLRLVGAGEVQERDSVRQRCVSSCTIIGTTRPSIIEEEPENQASQEPCIGGAAPKGNSLASDDSADALFEDEAASLGAAGGAPDDTGVGEECEEQKCSACQQTLRHRKVRRNRGDS